MGIAHISLDGKFLQPNQQFCEITGYNEAELLSLSFQDITHPDDLALSIEQVQKLLAGEIPTYRIEKRYIRKDHSILWIHVTGSLVRDRAGHPSYLIGTLEDITTRKKAEELIRFQASVLDQVRNAVIATNLKGEIIYWNQYATTLYHWTTPEVIDRNIRDVIIPAGSQDQGHKILGIIAKQGYWEGEFEVRRKDHTRFPIHGVLTSLHDPQGNPAGYVGISIDLTDHKQVEKTLQEREEIFRQLADTIEEAFFIQDAKDGKTLYISPAYERIWQRSCDQLYQNPDTWLASVYPEDRDRLVTELQRVRSGETCRTEYRILRPSSELRWVETQTFPIFDEAGQIDRIIGSAQDITDRKQAEATLKESESRFQAFMNNSPTASWITDENGRLVYVSETYYRVFQIPKDYRPGQTNRKLYDPELAKQYLANIQKVIQTRQVVEVIEKAPRQDGSIGDFLVYKFPLESLSGQRLVGGVGIDITERIRAEQALQQLNQELEARVEQRTAALQASEERFRNLVETSSDWVWEVDERGIYTYVSPKTLEILGYPPQEIIGKTPFDLMPPAEAERVAAIFFASAVGYQPLQCLENINLHQEGHAVVIETSAVPIFDRTSQGQFRGYRGINRDITQRKQTEAELLAITSLQQAIFDGIDYAIISTTLDHKIQTFNAAAQKMLGYTAEEVVGCVSPLIFHDPEEIQQRTNALSVELGRELSSADDYFVYQSQRGRFEEEWTFIRKDGSRFPILLSLKQLNELNGKPLGAVGIAKDITQQKQIEAQLRKNAAHLSTAQRIAHLGSWEFDLQTQDLIWSEEVFRITGRNPKLSSPTYDEFCQLIHPDDLEEHQVWLQKTLVKKQPYEREYRIYRTDGKVLHLLAQGEVILDEECNPVRLVETILDITERKEIEQSLKLSEARYRAIVEDQTELITRFLPDGTLQFVNEAYCRYLNLKREDLIGKSYAPNIFAEDLENVTRLVQSMSVENPTVKIENRALIKGKIRWTQWINRMLFDKNGQFVEFQSVGRDITELKETEAALRKSEEQLRNLSDRLTLALKSGAIGTWEWDLIHDVMFWDERQKELYGVEEGEITGRYQADNSYSVQQPAIANAFEFWANRLAPSELVKMKAELQQSLKDGAEYNREFRVIRPDGTVRVLESSALIQRDHQGNPQRMVGINYDITERKQTEEQLRDLSDRLMLALKSGAIGIWDWDIIRNVGFWDDRMYELYGLQRFELTNIFQFWQSCIYPEDWPAVEFSIEQALQDQKEYNHEFRVIHPDGALRVLKAYALVQRNQHGEPQRMVGINYDITDRKQAEEALQESRTMLQLVLDTIPQRVFWKDRQLAYLGCNSAFAREVGLSHPDEIVGKTDWDLTSATNIPRYHADDRAVIATGIAKLGYEEPKENPDGSLRWLRTSKVPLTNGAGEVMGVLASYEDITERKQAEEALAEYTREVEDLYNNAPCGYHSLDAEGRFVKVNDTELKLLGYTREEMLGQSLLRFLTEASRLRFLQNYPRFKERGWVKDLEYEMLCKNGMVLPVSISATAVKDVAGNYLYNRATLFDIRERKQAEATLKQQAQREQLLRVITHRVRQSLDVDEILTTAVAEVRQTFQADRALILRLLPDGKGQIIKEAILPPFPALAGQVWTDVCLNPNNIQHYSVRQPRIVADVALDEWGECLGKILQRFGVRSKISAPILQTMEDGSTQIWGLLIVHACLQYRQWVPEEAGFLQQISNQLEIAIQQANLYQRVQTELSERKQTEELLRQTNEQLAHTNGELARATRLKDEFLANMSHELRTPLNAILGMSEGLQEGVFGSMNVQQVKAIATIERSGKHLLELINDILDLSKIEAGKLELHISEVSIRSLCEASLAFIRQMADQKTIHLSTRIADPLPSLQADERRLRQILINLLSNAVKFTPAGGQITLEVWPELATEAKKAGEVPASSCLCFSVTDTGIGIALADLSKLFQAFVQIDSSLNRQYNGTGLGLALVQRIATLHGGTVSVKSEAGQGSCFTVRIPYVSQTQGVQTWVDSPFSQEVLSGEERQAMVSRAELEREPIAPLILLAEDNPANIDTISGYLESRGYRLILAMDGQQAVNLAQSHQPDLILMDIQMPGIDGLEAIRRIRAQGQTQVPIVTLTALAMAGDGAPHGPEGYREQALAAGANEYLTKPIKLKQLTVTIQQLLFVNKN